MEEEFEIEETKDKIDTFDVMNEGDSGDNEIEGKYKF